MMMRTREDLPSSSLISADVDDVDTDVTDDDVGGVVVVIDALLITANCSSATVSLN